MLLEYFIVIAAFSYTVACPSKESLYPCTCESNSEYSKYIKCNGIENDLDLLNAADALKGRKDIYSFSITNAILNYIPHNIFEGVKFVELEFMSSSIMAFTDTDVAFEGLEDSLEILTVTDCSFMNSWDWSLLKNMKVLMRIDIIQGDMESIDDNVREISNLNMKDLSFAENKISYIYDFAFANFTELMFLTLSNNLIKDVKRSMLPNPAPHLMQIDLGSNEIQQFPGDFFENMPALEAILIPRNKILVLKEETFSEVWGQLDAFQAIGNKLRCNCRMSWILQKRMPENLRAVCEQPAQLKGRSLAELTSKDLWC